MKRFVLFSGLIISLIFSSCVGKRFIAPDFSSKTATHRLIAVLPFEVTYTGRNPDNLTADDIAKIRTAEAFAFQKSLYNNLLDRTGTGKKDIKIPIQPVEKTNKILKDNDIDVLTIGSVMPEDLCKMLGVDAVVYSTVEKERFLTDLESFGVSVAQNIISKFRVDNPAFGMPYIPGNAARTYHIKSDCQAKNAADGVLLWKYAVEQDANWQSPASEVITNITKKTARKFPYR